jgi:hypothetical protein
MKKVWGTRLTTVWPRQGHYALNPQIVAQYSPADLTIERIGNLLNHDFSGVARRRQGRQGTDRERS